MGVPGAGLPPEAMLGDPCCLRAMLIKVACAATRDYGDIWVKDADEGHVWVPGPAAAKVCVDVHGFCHHQDAGVWAAT